MISWITYQLRYSLQCRFFMPVTFVRRVLFGNCAIAKRFFWEKWGFLSPEVKAAAGVGKVIWVIANSGGELIQASAFLRLLKQRLPGYGILLSTESYDTYAYAKSLSGVDAVFFAPWDIPGVTRRVLRKITPKAVVFIEHCYFPVLSAEAKRISKVFLLSGMCNDVLLHKYPLMQRSFGLRFFDHMHALMMKSPADAVSMQGRGVPQERISVGGDMKLDCGNFLLDDAAKARLRGELNLGGSDQVFIVGSLHEGEVALVFEAFAAIRKSLPLIKMIVAPRWAHDARLIEEAAKSRGFFPILRTKVTSTSIYDVLVIDTFGELPKLYGIATVALIAGTIVPINSRKLGHSIFEPVAHSTPVLFGPYLSLWKSYADTLIRVWPGCEVRDAASLAASVATVMTDARVRDSLRDAERSMSAGYQDISSGYVESLVRSLCVA